MGYRLNTDILNVFNSIDLDILQAYRGVVAWWYYIHEGSETFYRAYLDEAKQLGASPDSVFYNVHTSKWESLSDISNTVTLRNLNRILFHIDESISRRT